MIALGIDPGLTGAIAAVCSRRGLLDIIDIPVCANGTASGSMRNWVDVNALTLGLREWSRLNDWAADQVSAAMERPIAMPSLPAQTIASQFDSVGALRAVLMCRAAPVTMIEPGRWKKRYGLGRDKDASREAAMRLYPAARGLLARKKDHNRAEALLIADWHLQEINGERAAKEWAEAA